MKKRKKSNNAILNKVDINRYWTYCLADFDELNEPACFYYLDKNSFEFIYKGDLSAGEQKSPEEQTGTRYIKLFQYPNEQYESMLNLIQNQAVSKWFLSSNDEEKRCEKYRIFLDWNSLYEDEGYRKYLDVYPKFIKWCEENNLPYLFRGKLSPPDRYIYSNPEKLKTIKWEIPDVDL